MTKQHFDRFKTKRSIATLVNIGLEKHKCPYQPKKHMITDLFLFLGMVVLSTISLLAIAGIVELIVS